MSSKQELNSELNRLLASEPENYMAIRNLRDAIEWTERLERAEQAEGRLAEIDNEQEKEKVSADLKEVQDAIAGWKKLKDDIKAEQAAQA
jgi:hypothetical protein